MGMIRSGVLFAVVVLLFWSFFAGNIFLTMDMSLDYDNVKPELTAVIKEVAAGQIDLDSEVDSRIDEMNSYCENNTNVSEFVFSEQDQTFVVSCETIAQGSEAVLNQSIDGMVEEGYYKEYDCDFIDCIRELDLSQPFVLVSAKAKDYWKGKFYFSLIVSLILIVLVFFLVEQKFNLPIVVGIVMVLSSLPFMKINWLLSFFADQMYLQIFSIFLSKSYTVFLIMFSLGLFILILGVVLRFFKFGFWISGLFEKFGKKKDVEKSSKPVVPVKKVVKANKSPTSSDAREDTRRIKKVVGKK
ncbi:hypothetical protein GOV13_05590 [Candidatus Pacearchaeota archaeon]|nr:hypothetical protein [Candidatus Pacearchaeota archaeon]